MSETIHSFRDCFFCGADLPPLDAERLPQRERLAFDPGLGRLWRVCALCLRWNPVPLEDRWEVLEDCERLCRDEGEPVMHGDRLSLYRVRDGQLVRVGEPPRPAFADWRYSSRLDDYPVRRRSGWIERLLRLPERPVDAGGLSRTAGAGDLAPAIPGRWVGAAFVEHGMLLSALFLDVPLADRCPTCGGPFLLDPARFGDVHLLLERDAPAVAAECALCRQESAVPLSAARPALRAGIGLVERGHREPLLVERAVLPIERLGGPGPFVRRLCRREPALGSMAERDRLALWISLDEQAEAEALEAEWQLAEELASILDDELTDLPGFDAFRARVVAGTPEQETPS